jgi:hypothetical protein
MDPLAAATASAADLKLLVSTGNIVFPLTRLLLLAGQFNYGKRGILDLTRSSLFAFPRSVRLLEPLLVRGPPKAVARPPLRREPSKCRSLASRHSPLSARSGRRRASPAALCRRGFGKSPGGP